MDIDTERYELLIDLPLLKKGSIIYFEMQTSLTYGDENGKQMVYPIRQGLSGYLWLLRTYKPGKFMRESKF